MRPINGVVINRHPTGAFVSIKLENGHIIAAQNKEGLGLYDKVFVCYNFERKEVINVQRALDKLEERETGVCDSTLLEHDYLDAVFEEDVPPDDIMEDDSADSGALAPGSEGFWDSDSDSEF